MITSKDPESIIKSDYKFKLRGTRPLHYHLGCAYYREINDNLCVWRKIL